MRPPTAASLALALCLAGALFVPTAAAAAAYSRRLLGPAVPDSLAGTSKSAYAPTAPAGAGITGSSSAVGTWHGLSVAASKNTAGIAAAASNNWDFDKDSNGEGDFTDGDDNVAIPTGPAPRGFGVTAPQQAQPAAAPQTPPPAPVNAAPKAAVKTPTAPIAPAPKATLNVATSVAPNAAPKPALSQQAGRH